MNAQYLAERFDISLAAAEIRLTEIERMRRRATGKKRPLPDSIVRYLQDARKLGYQVRALDES